MGEAYSLACQELSPLEKQVLVERHLISREHALRGVGSAVVMNKRQTLSIMINEEDHLRMQALRSGLQLRAAYKAINKVDSSLESVLDFAFDSKLGYLTACPSNVGTGMRASAMVHVVLHARHTWHLLSETSKRDADGGSGEEGNERSHLP